MLINKFQFFAVFEVDKPLPAQIIIGAVNMRVIVGIIADFVAEGAFGEDAPLDLNAKSIGFSFLTGVDFIEALNEKQIR